MARCTTPLTIEGNTIMRYRIVDKDAFAVTGPKTRVPLVCEGPNEAMIEFVKGLGEATREKARELSDQEPHGLLGVTHALEASDGEGGDIDYYQAAVTSSTEVPEGMESLRVPAGTWVVFPFERYTFPEQIQRIWLYAFSEWFPSNPAYQHRRGPDMLKVDYDGQESGLASGELWMPVEKV